LAGNYPNGVRLTKKEMEPYEARLERSPTLRKYDITIKPSGRQIKSCRSPKHLLVSRLRRERSPA